MKYKLSLIYFHKRVIISPRGGRTVVYVYYKFTESSLTHREQHKAAFEMLGFLLKRTEGEDYCLNTGVMPKGKPYLTNSEAKFSVSHAKGCVVCALSSGKKADIPQNCGEYVLAAEIPVDARDVGCDVEPYGNKLTLRSKARITKKLFTEAEKQLIASSGEPENEFIRVWTAKESFVKCTGEGLGGIKKVDITALSDEYGIYKYEIFHDGHGYSVSVCIQK